VFIPFNDSCKNTFSMLLSNKYIVHTQNINTMQRYNGKLVELPKKGKALIITDIHGNITDFKKFMDIWDLFEDDDNHLILTGDFIHAMGKENDRSIEILEYVKYKCENYNNFHVLLGNHEWATISKKPLFKSGINQTHNFDELLKVKFPKEYNEKLDDYVKFFKKLPIAVRTANRIFISHAGPPDNITSLDEVINITEEGYTKNSKLIQMLWNRKDDFSKEDLKRFLKTVDCQMMIVGHTPVDGIKMVYKNQLIVSSSYGKGKKAYIELDLEKNIKKNKELLKMVRYLK
jgi:Icc-related predicted phosphoesterase